MWKFKSNESQNLLLKLFSLDNLPIPTRSNQLKVAKNQNRKWKQKHSHLLLEASPLQRFPRLQVESSWSSFSVFKSKLRSRFGSIAQQIDSWWVCYWQAVKICKFSKDNFVLKMIYFKFLVSSDIFLIESDKSDVYLIVPINKNNSKKKKKKNKKR